MYNNYLYHHGIKGQKWGVRRYQNPDGTLTEEGKRKMNPDKAIKKMSDSELETITKRLSMESQYRNLRREDSQRGRDAAKMALKVIGTVGVASVGIASITVGKEALKSFGTNLGKSLANTVHDSVTAAMKNAADSAAKNIAEAPKNIASNVAKNISKAVNGNVTSEQRSKAIERATQIGYDAAKKAMSQGMSRERANAYANEVRQKAFERILKEMAK